MKEIFIGWYSGILFSVGILFMLNSFHPLLVGGIIFIVGGLLGIIKTSIETSRTKEGTRLGHDYNTYIKHYGSADVFSEKDRRRIRDLYVRSGRF